MMQKFEYRAPRFAVDLTVQFTTQNSTLIARCREISKNGMTLELREPLPPNSLGTLSLNYRERTIQLRVRVAHAGANYNGLQFIYESDEERNEVAHFVASVTAPQNRPGPVLMR